jgi:hypothetical protein
MALTALRRSMVNHGAIAQQRMEEFMIRGSNRSAWVGGLVALGMIVALPLGTAYAAELPVNLSIAPVGAAQVQSKGGEATGAPSADQSAAVGGEESALQPHAGDNPPVNESELDFLDPMTGEPYMQC